MQALRAASSYVRPAYRSCSRRPVTVVRMAASGAAPPPSFWVLRYEYVAGILEKRGPFREAHLKGAQAKLDSGNLVCAGATGSPPDGAMFLFKGIGEADVEAFVKADPYFQNGLVAGYKISPYAVAVGNL
ncbi:MAG: hypothetical protein J3K34DRAFT_417812 [Monoraphidium minutum]|nr:MAG: hypothetical protein J3K34DRAFT_417812 [Monoraphidium minutum]